MMKIEQKIISFKNKYFSLAKLALVIMMLTLVFTSCKKTLVNEETPNNATTVSFRVSSNDIKQNLSKKAFNEPLRTTETILIKENSATHTKKLQIPTISLEKINDIEFMKPTFGIPSSSEGLKKIAASSPMVPKVKYRIVILDLSNNIVTTVQSTVHEIVSIDLVLGQQYNWYAYSYDDENEIPAPSSSQIIETPINRDLLYAKSNAPFTVVAGENPISIIFNHQLALLSIELDYDRLFATIPTNNANSESISENLDWEIRNQADFLYKGNFSLLTGEVSDQELYAININDIVKDHPTSKNVKVAQCYFVPPPSGAPVSNTVTVRLNSLKVKFPNRINTDQMVEDPNGMSNTFQNLSSTKGAKYIAKFKFSYNFNKKLNILHVTRDNNYAYAAQPRNFSEGSPMTASSPTLSPLDHHTSYNMIKEPRNFGLLPNSVVRADGFGHRRISTNFHIDTALHLGNNPTIPPPDIVIIGTYYQMDDNDTQALVDYVNRGGVLFLMSDGINTSDYQSHRLFFQRLFNDLSTTSNLAGFENGSVYKLADIDDEILNGPFGDVRMKHWGEDASKTIALENYPIAEVTAYSKSLPVNHLPAVTSPGATMIRHNKKHFFWVGDGGFIACDEVSGAHGSPSDPVTGSWASYANQPFATATSSTKTSRKHPYPYDEVKHYEFFPVPRKYGYTGNGYLEYHHDVYNSTVFANFMAWAVANATFYGINTGGLPQQ